MQAGDYTQSFNRYAYCLNNPLTLVDPTGYSWLSKNWKPLLVAAVGITVGALTGNAALASWGAKYAFAAAVVGGAAGGAAGALTDALLNGANFNHTMEATFRGAFWGAVSAAADFGSADPDLIASLFKHAFTEGAITALQGGNMVHGMMMGALSCAGNSRISNIDGIGKAGKVILSATLGGTVAEIGGGKFANGAITAAYSMMFNELMHGGEGEDVGDVLSTDLDNANQGKISAACITAGSVLLSDDITGVGLADDGFAIMLYGAGAIIGAIEYGPQIISMGKDVINGIGNYIKSYKEHSKNPTPSNIPKHQKGQSRKQRDKSGEKGDKRRKRYK